MSRRLTSIEINATFYRGQRRDSFARWGDETPDGFVFAVKGPRGATHRRKLAEARESIERFVDSGLAALSDKLGPINWQLPPTKRFEPDDLAGFFDLLPASVEGRPLRHAIEARHTSFAAKEFVALARKRGVAIVVAGDADYPLIADPTAAFVYARLMGTTESERRTGHLGAARKDIVQRRDARRSAAAAKSFSMSLAAPRRAIRPPPLR